MSVTWARTSVDTRFTISDAGPALGSETLDPGGSKDPRGAKDPGGSKLTPQQKDLIYAIVREDNARVTGFSEFHDRQEKNYVGVVVCLQGGKEGKSGLVDQKKSLSRFLAFRNDRDCLRMANSRIPVTFIYSIAGSEDTPVYVIEKIVTPEQARQILLRSQRRHIAVHLQKAFAYGTEPSEEDLDAFVEEMVRPEAKKNPQFWQDILAEASRANPFVGYKFTDEVARALNGLLLKAATDPGSGSAKAPRAPNWPPHAASTKRPSNRGQQKGARHL
ncbi:MAG: hypothetical protein C5B49_06770 [Bdellovibrio sp.]|nr:MAG: hypothetical protein C5B49_06770 [Bdellovibrio sp.]